MNSDNASNAKKRSFAWEASLKTAHAEHKKALEKIEAIRAIPTLSFWESPSEKHTRKELDLQKNLELIIKAATLEDALGPAEECIRILNFLQELDEPIEKKTKNKKSGNKIDPVHTLVGKLIDHRRLDAAEQISSLYIYLLEQGSRS